MVKERLIKHHGTSIRISKVRFRLLFVSLFLIFSISTQAQTLQVLSAKDKSPIPFAHILITPKGGKDLMLMTDINGKATLNGKSISDSIPKIQISCLGFERYSGQSHISHLTSHVFYLTPSIQTLNEVVITGQYAPNSPEKATHKIRIIDQKKIEAMAAVNLRDVLTNEMNIRLSQDNILGSSMTLQGVSGENVKILIDGVPVIGRQNGNIDLSQINLGNIQRVEIIEGPMSVSYGTNALAGTINLISKKPKQNRVEGGISSYYETVGNYNLTGRLEAGKGNSSVSVSGGRNFFDGWSNGEKIALPSTKAELADSNRFQQWKPKEQYFGTGQYNYRLKKLILSYKGEYFQEKIINRGLPRLPYGETAFDDAYRTRRLDNAVFANGEIAHHKNINFLVAYNHFTRTKNTWFRDLTTLGETLSETPGDQDTSHFTLLNSRATFSTANDSLKLNYELGYDINVETGTGIRMKDGRQQIGDFAAFASAEYWPVKSLVIRPGLRYGYNTSYQAPVLPSLNLKFSPNLRGTKQSLSVRLSYARGFRSPSLKDLYFYFVDINHNIKGNETLKAEASHNLNGSLNYTHTQTNQIFKLELAGYYTRISNLITLAQTTGTEYAYINIGQYQTLGTSLSVEIGINHLKVSVAGLYAGRYNPLSETNNVATFSYSPEVRSSVFYDVKKWNLTVALFYKYSGQLPGFIQTATGEVQQTFIQSYHTADATLTKKLWKNRIAIGIGSKNLFNIKSINSFAAARAHSSGGNSMPVANGRTYFLKIDINISKENQIK